LTPALRYFNSLSILPEPAHDSAVPSTECLDVVRRPVIYLEVSVPINPAVNHRLRIVKGFAGILHRRTGSVRRVEICGSLRRCIRPELFKLGAPREGLISKAKRVVPGCTREELRNEKQLRTRSGLKRTLTSASLRKNARKSRSSFTESAIVVCRPMLPSSLPNRGIVH